MDQRHGRQAGYGLPPHLKKLGRVCRQIVLFDWAVRRHNNQGHGTNHSVLAEMFTKHQERQYEVLMESIANSVHRAPFYSSESRRRAFTESRARREKKPETEEQRQRRKERVKRYRAKKTPAFVALRKRRSQIAYQRRKAKRALGILAQPARRMALRLRAAKRSHHARGGSGGWGLSLNSKVI